MPRLYRKLRAIYGCADFVRQPTAINSFQIAEGLRDSNALRRAVLRMREQEPVAGVFRERYLCGFPDIGRLLACPEGSLGREYGAMMSRLGLDYSVFPKARVCDDVTYYLARGRETHDVWHVVTGFGTDVPGELGLQAFQLAQLEVPISKVLVGLGILRTVLYPELLDPVVDAVARGWRMGKRSAPLIAQRWEDAWDRPLATWRQALGLDAADGAPGSRA